MKSITRFSVLGLALLVSVSCSINDKSGSALVRTPDTASRLRVAAVAEASNQPDVALAMYTAAAQADPDNVEVQALYVSATSRAGHIAAARSAIDTATKNHPNNLALQSADGRLRLIEGRPQDALTIFRQIAAAQPSDVRALVGEGVSMDMLGDHDAAQTFYARALVIDPDNLAAANNYGLSLLLAGHPAEAAMRLDNLRKRTDSPQRVTSNYALAEASSGHADIAHRLLPASASDDQIQSMLHALAATK